MNTNVWQRALLVVAVLCLLILLVQIGLAVAATIPGSTPARKITVMAGPYQLVVSLYKDPAEAGLTLPFSVVPEKSIQSPLTYTITTLPGSGVNATPIRASLTPAGNGVQGAAEITVQGPWEIAIVVNGPAGRGEATVPIIAIGPPAIPLWTGWLIGCIPIYSLLIFLMVQSKRKEQNE